MSALEARRLWKYYDRKPVLEGIDLQVDSGQFCTIVGASGCGKSTFLKMLLGVERPTRGALLLDGQPLPPEPDANRGIVFQRYSVYPHLSVLENVMLGLELSQSRWLGRLFGARRRAAAASAMEMLDAVGLANSAGQYPSALSGGMQQRLALAQSVVKAPKVLLLDEPFGALDPGTRSAMQSLVSDLWRQLGLTVFMVTHDLSEAFRLGTRLLVFDKIRHDPQAPDAYGARITYDIPLERRSPALREEVARSVSPAAGAASGTGGDRPASGESAAGHTGGNTA